MCGHASMQKFPSGFTLEIKLVAILEKKENAPSAAPARQRTRSPNARQCAAGAGRNARRDANLIPLGFHHVILLFYLEKNIYIRILI